MRFTIKGFKDSDQERIYQGIAKFVQQASPTPITNKRVWSIDCELDGKHQTLRVTDSSILGEDVICIFETERNGPFLICTDNRGVTRGMPIMIGKDKVHAVYCFDA
jgi:hypothetical protein